MVELDGTDLESPNGTRLRLWSRTPADATEAVCFVHGATYGGRSAFDPEGVSWLAAVAEVGRAAFAIDVRGYGDSERPPEFESPAHENEPIVRADTAARDAATALGHVRESYGTVHLVGYSWGTITAGHLLTEHGASVASLVQYAPVYRPPPENRERLSPGDPPEAYRRVTKAEARDRWADQRADDSVPTDAFEAFWDALVSSDLRAGDDEIVAPNGTLVDLQAAIDDPPYAASDIDVPTLVVRGTLDTASTRDDALGLYDELGASDRGYAEIAGGTHFLQLEERRAVLYDAVRTFQNRVGDT